jgi:hypothetical protein
VHEDQHDAEHGQTLVAPDTGAHGDRCWCSDPRSDGSTDTSSFVAWNRDDALQDMLVRKVSRRDVSRPQHFVPKAEGFGAAVRAWLGRGMFAERLAAAAPFDGSLVRESDARLDVLPFWQCWRLDSPMVKTITDAVRSVAAGLRGPSCDGDAESVRYVGSHD